MIRTRSSLALVRGRVSAPRISYASPLLDVLEAKRHTTVKMNFSSRPFNRHVDWHFQREAAEKAVRYIPGVVEVLNHVEVVPAPSPKDVRRRITESLHRNADLNARHVEVTVSGSVATLTGRVSSWTQRLAAERAAADAPGISRVDNRLEVSGADF